MICRLKISDDFFANGFPFCLRPKTRGAEFERKTIFYYRILRWPIKPFFARVPAFLLRADNGGMDVFVFFRLIFIVLAVVGISLLLPLGVAVACGENSVVPSFLIPMIVSVALGLFFFFAGKKKTVRFSTRSVFLFVASAWIFISLFGSVPLLMSGEFASFSDAFFESCSGFTTTGATVLSDIERLPRSLNLWRCEMHWLGGMGIIALTVALLPLLGVGGFNLIKAESTGPEKGKITPKMANTAEMLWILYGSLTLLLALALKICGMDAIDCISYAFSTLGTGGFATRNASVASYGSAPIEIVCTVFMFLAGVNFSLYFYIVTGKFSEVRRNTELKAYLVICLVFSILIAVFLVPQFGGFFSALRYSAFQVASIVSSTGYMTSDYLSWSPPAQFVIFALFFVGGCSGSTAGGFKVVRWCILAKQCRNEMMKMLHPHGVFSIRLNGSAGRNDLVFTIGSFVFVYFGLVVFTTFLGTLGHLDVLTSFTASLSMVGNIGPAFGSLGPADNYGVLPPALKFWYCFAMIAGRLELYNLLILFLPEFWRK